MTSFSQQPDQDRPPSYPGPSDMDEVRRDSTALPAGGLFFNEALMSFTGRVAASYLSRQNNKSSHSILGPFGSGILQLPPDLEVAKKSLISTMYVIKQFIHIQRIIP